MKDYVGDMWDWENLIPHLEDEFRSKTGVFEDMAKMIRTSYASLNVIPEEQRYLIHAMYEDNDLDGATEAERVFDFIERVDPGRFVIILANDSVTPPCCNAEGHYHCHYYDPYWYTVLIKASVWEEYKERVEAKHQEWVSKHQCKFVER